MSPCCVCLPFLCPVSLFSPALSWWSVNTQVSAQIATKIVFFLRLLLKSCEQINKIRDEMLLIFLGRRGSPGWRFEEAFFVVSRVDSEGAKDVCKSDRSRQGLSNVHLSICFIFFSLWYIFLPCPLFSQSLFRTRSFFHRVFGCEIWVQYRRERVF